MLSAGSCESCFLNQTVRARTGNLDAITTVPMGKLHKNTNLDKASFLSTKQKLFLDHDGASVLASVQVL